MSDLGELTGAQAPEAPPDHPAIAALDDFLGSLPEGGPSDWGQSVASQVADFVGKQSIAIRNTQIGQKVADSIKSFTDLMNGVVRANPTAVDMAIGVGNTTADALVNDHPYLSDEQRPGVADALKGEFAQQFARSSVMGWSLVDADHAHDALDRFKGLFPPEQVAQMRDHIDVLHDARQTDVQQQQELTAQQRTDLSTSVLVQLANGLATNGVPQGFNTKTTIDQRLSPDDTLVAQNMAQRLLDVQTGKVLPGKTDASLLMTGVTNALTARRSVPNIMNDLVRANVPVQDVAQFAQLLQHPDDAKQFAWALNAAKLRNLGADGESLSPANTDKLNEMAHFLLQRYTTEGAAAFKDLPLNPLASGGLEAQLQTRAIKQTRLDQIFALREERNVYMQQRLAFEKAKTEAELTFRQQQAHLTEQHRIQTEQRAAAERAQARADRLREAALNRQQRAQEAADRIAEQRAAALARERAAAQAPARGRAPNYGEQFLQGARLFRALHKGT